MSQETFDQEPVAAVQHRPGSLQRKGRFWTTMLNQAPGRRGHCFSEDRRIHWKSFLGQRKLKQCNLTARNESNLLHVFQHVLDLPRMSAPRAARCRLCRGCLWLEIALLRLSALKFKSKSDVKLPWQPGAFRNHSLSATTHIDQRWMLAFPTIWRASMPTGLMRRFPTFSRHADRSLFEADVLVIV